MNQEMSDAVLKVLRENVHLSYYPEVVEVNHYFVAVDPYAIGRFNGIRLVTAGSSGGVWSYHPRYVSEEVAKMIALIVDTTIEPEENTVWNTGLITLMKK